MVLDTGVPGNGAAAEMENVPDYYFGGVHIFNHHCADFRYGFEHSPIVLDKILTSALVVGALTWGLMPWFSRYIFRKWLYKDLTPRRARGKGSGFGSTAF